MLPPPVSALHSLLCGQLLETWQETRLAAEEENIEGPKREEMHEPLVEKARMPLLLPKSLFWP